jgi:beta-glucosidase-like glycosyl hydrolase/CubicO group peptidase (beta-lactamase class C family)
MRVFIFISKVLIFSILIFGASSFINFEFAYSPNNSKEDPLTDTNTIQNIEVNTLNGKTDPDFISYKSKWIDSVFNSLSIEDKISQLIIVATYSNKGSDYTKSMESIIKKYKIGGFIFFQGSPVKQAQLTNYYQSISKTPLIIAMDAEWGLSMRLDSTINYPRQMMMGAIQDDQVVYDFGLEVGRQCNRLGVHINFAPVIDINNNPKNPVINSRSFGEDRLNVAQKGHAYMIGMQHKNIITTAKHFPGHGDTESDSHYTLPVINHSFKRLDSIEFFPFKYLIDNGLTGIMVAHLNIPVLDSSSNSAASLSHNIITKQLKERLQFKGLVFTDALGMKGVSSYNSAGEVALKAFMAGTDMLLMPADIESAIKTIKNALDKGLINEKDINSRCYKVLQAKKWVGLDKYKPVEIKGLTEDINSSEAKFVHQKVIESAITLVENKEQIIPIKNLDIVKVASVSIGTGNLTKFQKTLSLYDDVKHFSINKSADINEFKALTAKLSEYDVVIVSYVNSNHSPSSFGITGNSIWFSHELTKYTKVIVDIFASPYVLSKFQRSKFAGIVMSYEDGELCQDLSAQLIYGGIPAYGKLPVSAGKEYPSRTGISDEKIRLKYTNPKELNIDDKKLRKIDTIILSAIDKGAIPGCQVLAAKDGMVFFNKSYGYQTYEKKNKVTNDDLYDLASVTKVCGTLPVIMKLVDDGKLNINEKLSKYLSELDSTNKSNITIKQILAHQAGLIPWIPFYIRTFDPAPNNNYRLDSCILNSEEDSVYCLKVADNLFINKNYVDSMYTRIYNSPIKLKAKYKYSDLGFYLFYRMISASFNIALPEYLYKNFYSSLGSSSLCYNPLDKFPRERIVPTEKDRKFRKQLVQGYVHDYGAAMMGGVGGHAGLFSNANDLAKLLQMYLQKGEYGGKRYIQSSTLELFTSSAYSKNRNRRALGFDKPALTKKSPVSKLASQMSFGHTGFTGTIVWVDPKEQFIYVFLSNRVYPNIENNLISELAVRNKVHEVFYNSFR